MNTPACLSVFGSVAQNCGGHRATCFIMEDHIHDNVLCGIAVVSTGPLVSSWRTTYMTMSSVGLLWWAQGHLLHHGVPHTWQCPLWDCRGEHRATCFIIEDHIHDNVLCGITVVSTGPLTSSWRATYMTMSSVGLLWWAQGHLLHHGVPHTWQCPLWDCRGEHRATCFIMEDHIHDIVLCGIAVVVTGPLTSSWRTTYMKMSYVWSLFESQDTLIW